jgi:hypothetical protein
LELTEQPAKLGEVEITGQFINRLILEGGPCTVVLDSPGRTAKVPVGTYTEARVTLKQGKAEAYWDSNRSGRAQRFVVDGNKPTVIALGGPLTNSVSVQRRGESLQLSYQLLGGGGQKYNLANEDRSKPPEFVVYKAGKKIASGKFEYG